MVSSLSVALSFVGLYDFSLRGILLNLTEKKKWEQMIYLSDMGSNGFILS